LARRGRGALLLVLLLGAGAMVAGCGEEGVAGGATVTVYVSAPLRGEEAGAGRQLCDEAREQASQGKGDEDELNELRLRVVCLDASGAGGGWTLAKVGANARAATEDSTAIAYVGEPDPEARKQSRAIVAAAGIAQIGRAGGREAVAQIQAALGESDSGDPRDAVFDVLG
jgi:hypothetical protein